MPDYWVSYQCPKANTMGDTRLTTAHPLTRHHMQPIREILAQQVRDRLPSGIIRIEVWAGDIVVTNIFLLMKGDDNYVALGENDDA